jgi:GTP-binding protein HflX
LRKLDRKEAAALRAKEADEGTFENAPGARTRAAVVVPFKKPTDAPSGERPLSDRLSNAERLAEAIGLARAIDLDVCFSGLSPLVHPRPATLLGSGKVEEIGAIVKAEKIAVVIVDHAVSPIQQRNLEKAWNAKVIDRTGLILEIFAGRARSKEGRLQVELARLTYQKGRLVRSWTHLERQRGGFGFLGGPGETQIEADRRVIGGQIHKITAELGVVERTRRLHRSQRKSAGQQIVSLVGYTNAGKSTLFNVLSGESVLAKDMLFATLDPTLRRVKLASGETFILSDTVGFISDLPPQLIAAFRATLEETLEADLILHVRDIASESSEAQRAEVQRVLTEIGIAEQDQAKRVVEVWNKADLLSAEDKQRLSNRVNLGEHSAVLVSAATGEGVAELMGYLQNRLAHEKRTRTLVVDHGNGPLINWLYENTEILDRQDYHDGSLHFQVRLPPEREPDLDRRLHKTAS